MALEWLLGAFEGRVHNPGMSPWSLYLPFLKWPRPDAALWRNELLAGVTVALLMVPQSVAYAALAGMPLITGLYAAVLPALVGVMWGGSTRLSVGPTALTCLLISASLTGMAEPGSVLWVQMAVWLAVLSGLLQLALGAGGYGWLLNLISSPVMTGFTQAAALLIIASQLGALLGLPQGISGFFVGPEQGQVDVSGLGYGVVSVLLLWAGKRWAPRWPLIMAVVLGAGLLSHVTQFAARGGDVIGLLPSGLPTLLWPHWPGYDTLSNLLVPAMVIALVSFLETASSARTENQRDGKRWQDNQDLIAQGLAKLVSAACGSFATSASFSRSAVYLAAGARTAWAAVITAVLVGLSLLMADTLYDVPRAVLSAVVIAAVTNLLQPKAFVKLWRIQRVEAVTAGVTFVITLLSAPRIYWGVLAGVVLGLSHFLHNHLHPRIIEVGLHPDGSLRDRHLWHLPPLAPHTYALRMDAELDFAAASAFERNLVEHVLAHPQLQHVVLLAQPINRIDVTGVEVFAQVRRQLQQRGVVLHISGIKLPVETALKRAGELTPAADLRLYRTDTEMLEAMKTLA